MTLTAAQREERARKGGNAAKRIYGGATKRGQSAYYRSLAKRSPRAGAPRVPSLDEDMETAAGRRAMAEIAASYGVPREAIPALTGRAQRGNARPASSSPAGRRASVVGAFAGDQLRGNALALAATPAPGVDASHSLTPGIPTTEGMN